MKIVKPIIFTNFESTRASTATYYDENGILQTAGIDEVRFTHNPTTLEFIGPLLEGEATNLLTRSQNLAHSDWTFNGSTSGIGYPPPTPDGGTTGQWFSLSNAGTKLVQDNPVTLGEMCAFSVYLNRITGSSDTIVIKGNTGQGEFNLVTGTATAAGFGGIATIQGLPNGWYRCSIIGEATADEVGMYKDISGGGSQSIDFYAWGAQCELGDTVTSYIETTTAPATRAADIEDTTPPRVVESNVDENDAPEWVIGDSYTVGDPVMVLGQTHKVYEALTNNTGKFPPDHPEEWIDQGATNRWRMFDMSVGAEKQTVSTNSSNTVEVLLDVDQTVTSVTLLNVEGSTARIIMRDNEGNIVYDRTVELLQSAPSPDWWSFFFATRSAVNTVVLTDLPSVRPATIEMILDGDDLPAKIGKMIVGEVVEIGCARYGTSIGIVDFSRKERDPFGNNFILERRYIDRADFDVQILTNNIDNVKSLLASIRATPALYIGDEDYNSTIIYGFYRDFSIVISGPRRSDAAIQVESI